MVDDNITDEVRNVVQKVEKLLRLAAKNPNEAEAAAATNKAQELLAAYNLDMAAVEQLSGEGGKRAQEDLEGGRYQWQRDLWTSVAELNFCLYWSQIAFVESPLGKIYQWDNDRRCSVRGVQKHQHRLVGRTVNVAATKAMAPYLEQAVDRLTRERCVKGKIDLRGRWANSYREGITASVVRKIYARHEQFMHEEARKRHEAEAAAREFDKGQVSTSTAITLSSYVKSEEDANIDFVYGAGTSAQWAQDRARRAAAKKAADDAYTAWAAANPKEAARDEAKREAEAERASKRGSRGRSYNGDAGAYWAGVEAGKSVSIDRQAEGSKVSGAIR